MPTHAASWRGWRQRAPRLGWSRPSPSPWRRRGAGCRGRGGRRAAGSPVPRGRGPRRCDHGLRHNLTGRYHPWTNGQAERLNRTVKDATVKDAIVKAYHHVTHAALADFEAHVRAFLAAYNVAKHLYTYATMGTPCLAWWASM